MILPMSEDREPYQGARGSNKVSSPLPQTLNYLVSLCGVCLRQRLQNFENSSRPVVVFLFFVVE
jgi:hypothetical protein